MLLEDLVKAIQTVQARIREHGNTLNQNEYRTRIALIDPILNALGGDVSDPGLVTHEYAVGSGRADYALLREDGSPTAFIEAKRLGEMGDPSRHETQLFTYAVTQGVKYAGLTDGDRWLFDNLTTRFSGGESRLLDVKLSRESAHQCALKLLLLWHPTLAAGQPQKANQPVLNKLSEDGNGQDNENVPPISEGWQTLDALQASDETRLPIVKLPDGEGRRATHWYGVLVETAEWLIRSGDLRAEVCSVRNSRGGGLVHTEPREASGHPFSNYRTLSNGLFVKTHGAKFTLLGSTRILLERFGKDPKTVLLKVD